MKLVDSGPDIPTEVLQAQEEGNLILFCGAGVSSRAGLGDFKWLVDQVYEQTNLSPDDVEAEEYAGKQYDRVLGLLDHTNRAGPTGMRKAVAKALRLAQRADLSTHRALCELGTISDGRIRLVTTNFDRGFADGSPRQFEPYKAPALPSPARSLWNGVVHLHGLIDYSDDTCLPHLVLTSADFGRAYLVERWASTFVTEVFRQFTVLFVGYSVSDPVVRYIVDAFAAARRAGDQSHQPYVLTPQEPDAIKRTENKWNARGIAPILYDPHDNHSLLHDSLKAWADMVRDGFFAGRVSTIKRYAAIKPTAPYEHDYRVSQVIWALSEEKGDIAYRFATLKIDEAGSPPPVDWLPVLDRNGLLGYPPGQDGPALAGWDYPGGAAPRLHPVTRSLGIWTLNHLKETPVQEWLLANKGLLHPEFRKIIQTHLTLDRHQRLDEPQRRLWLLASSDSFPSSNGRPDTTYLLDGTWDFAKKRALLGALVPTATLKEPYQWHPLEGAPQRVFDLAHVEVGISSADQVKFIVDELSKKDGWYEALRGMASELTSLLINTMELLQWVGRAERLWDSSHHEIPSIEPHFQNRRWGEWFLIIELVRDSWLAVAGQDISAAQNLAGIWRCVEFPVFRRLEAFSRTRLDVFPAQHVVDFLSADDGWWLWSIETRREYIQLLKTTWPALNDAGRESVCRRILSGPPREMFRPDLTGEEWSRLRDSMVWLRLAKLDSTGVSLPASAQGELDRLTEAYQWQLAEDDRDEIVGWITVGREVESTTQNSPPPTPARLREILRSSPQEQDGPEWEWTHAVNQDPWQALLALKEVCEEPGVEITVPLVVLLERYRPQESYVEILGLTKAILDRSEPAITLNPAATFLRDIADRLPDSAELPFWDMWDSLTKALTQNSTEVAEDAGDPVNQALNRPGGRLVDALFERLGKLKIQVGGGLPSAYARRLENLLQARSSDAATMIASRLGYLWAVDTGWTREQVLPMLMTKDGSFDEAAWAGYVCNARLDPELLEILKDGLIIACGNRARLGRWCDSACALFTVAAISLPKLFTASDTREALNSMDKGGRKAVAQQIRQELQHADEKASSLWRNRIAPWLKMWPQAGDLTNPGVSRELALAAVRSGDAFEDAVNTVFIYLRNEPDEGHGNNWVHFALADTKHPETFPWATLKLLAAAVSYADQWPGPKFREVLDRMVAADSSITSDPRYRPLSEYLGRHGE